MNSILSAQYLRNGSLEGPVGDDEPPYGWFADSLWNDPVLYETYRPYTGDSEITPEDGEILCLLRARGKYYTQSDHAPYQRESIYQRLQKPLEARSCFTFEASLCTNPNNFVGDSEDPDKDYPLKLQVWVGNAPNAQNHLLVETGLIENLEWERFTFSFSTIDTAYSYIYITVMWDTITVKPFAYNGMILLDDLHLTYQGSVSNPVFDTLDFMGDNNTFLVTEDGINYVWTPEEYVSKPRNDSVWLLEYHENIVAIKDDGSKCPSQHYFHILFSCDKLYPDLVSHTYFFKYHENIILEASVGEKYNWDPPDYLNKADIRMPHLTEFYDSFSVNIIDKYGCEFKEKFEIIYDCDIVFPQGSILVLDTLLDPGSTLMLQTVIGTPRGSWQPHYQLDCPECPQTLARPVSSLDYTIQCEDKFGCLYNEVFSIDVALQIPNIITPNGDTFNDCFKVYGLPEGTSLTIFDKQGNKIDRINNYLTGSACWPDAIDTNISAGNYWYVFEHPSVGVIAKGFLLIKR